MSNPGSISENLTPKSFKKISQLTLPLNIASLYQFSVSKIFFVLVNPDSTSNADSTPIRAAFAG